MARPSVDLDWAENDVVDPTSGQNNKVEPPTSWKNNGWGYQEKPPRNYDNYHKWNTGQWIKYLDQVGVRPATYFVAANDAAAETKLHADAVCDGVNDEVQIQAAVDSVAATGGLVLLSEGTFRVAAQILLSSDNDVHIKGMGPSATAIKIADGSSSSFNVIQVTSSLNVKISDLEINGNQGSATGESTGIAASSSHALTIRDVFVSLMVQTGTGGHGIDITGCNDALLSGCYVSQVQGNGIVSGATTNRLRVEGCYSYNNSEDGFFIDGTGCVMVGCCAHDNTSMGFTINGDNCAMSACSSYQNEEHGINVGGQYNGIDNCTVWSNELHGVYVAACDDCTIKGCTIHTNSQGTHNTSSGIFFVTGSQRNTVTDNKIRQGAASPQQKYAIDLTNVTSAGDSNYVYNNDCVTGGVTGIFDGTGSAKTIPQYAWTGSAHVADSVVDSNRVA